MIDLAQFIGGTAKGKTLPISRVPLFLRVAVTPIGILRVLDAVDAEPADVDRVTVYRRMSTSNATHQGQDAHLHGYFHVAAPDQATTHSTEAWQAWCIDNARK